jgi:hypothetical protein
MSENHHQEPRLILPSGQENECHPPMEPRDDMKLVPDSDSTVIKEKEGCPQLNPAAATPSELLVADKLPEADFKPCRLPVKSKWLKENKLSATSGSARKSGGPKKLFLAALVVVPCVLAVIAAIAIDVRDAKKYHEKYGNRHYNNIDVEIQQTTDQINQHSHGWLGHYKRAWLHGCNHCYKESIADLDLAAKYSKGDSSATKLVNERRTTILELRKENWGY